MDRVRFGRALGQGTRAAARALLDAADAATAPDPNPSPNTHSTPQRPEPSVPRVAAQAARKVQRTKAGVRAGSRNFVQAAMAPVAKVSRILWLEVTGSLFALFAVASALEVYRHRAGLHTAGDERRNLVLGIAMLILFGAFTLSSFVRAARRGKA